MLTSYLLFFNLKIYFKNKIQKVVPFDLWVDLGLLVITSCEILSEY